jgi:alkylhydroperoxidase family enzyme
VSANRQGIEDDKIAALHEYRSSPLFDERERVAIEYAMAAASVPNLVTDALYDRLAEHWTEEEIVELLGVVCMFGVFNRWNDSMATPLEDEPLEMGRALLSSADWDPSKHT